jgi:hypothetical protein
VPEDTLNCAQLLGSILRCSALQHVQCLCQMPSALRASAIE